MNDPKFKTIFGTWVSATDVESPDELEDPGDYYEWLSSLTMEEKIDIGIASEDEIDAFEEENEGESDDDGDDDDDFF